MRFRLADRSGPPASYAELAKAAGVSLATLRHYFGDRDAAVAAILQIHGSLAEPHLQMIRQPLDDFAASVSQAVEYIAEGLDQPLVAQLHATGIAEGLAHPDTGPAYLNEVLEPTILALEDRLAHHMVRGQMRHVDARAAALMLISPLILAHLHQHWLGGTGTRPLSETDYRQVVTDAFVTAFAN